MARKGSPTDDRMAIIGAAWTVLERAGFEGFKVQLVFRETGLSARSSSTNTSRTRTGCSSR